MVGFDIELADETLDEEEIDGAADGDDAVGAGVRDDLDGGFFTGGATACGVCYRDVGNGSTVRHCVLWSALDARGAVGGLLLIAEHFVEGGGEHGDIGEFDIDETGGDEGGRFIDLSFDIDELANQGGVFGDDNGGGIAGGGDGTEGPELFDDLGEGADGFIGFDVIQLHEVSDDGIALWEGVVFGVNRNADLGGEDSTAGEREEVEIGIRGVRDENEILDGGGFFEDFGCLGVGERILRCGTHAECEGCFLGGG